MRAGGHGHDKTRPHLRARTGYANDPLFAGFSKEIVVKESHAFQLSDVPPGFDLLASTPDCQVQAIKHRQRLVYGVQFHPEAYDTSHPDGRTLLENFFRLALGKP